MGSTSHEHNASDLRRQLFWTARLERFVQHLFLALLAFGLLPKGSDQKRGVETMLDILETWLTGYTRQGPPGQRDTLPEGDLAAMRAELDRQTEIAAKASVVHAENEAARTALASVHGIEPAALTLPELVQRTIDVIAARTNARTILAEQDALRYRAELHTAQRELATEREQRKANESRRALSHQGLLDHLAQAQSHVRECEGIINGCRAAFGKKPMGAEGEEYMDLVADVTAAVQACNRGTTKDVSRDLAVIIGRTCDTLQIAKGAPIVERAEALEAFATHDGALVPLPKPAKIEAGQRWAFVMIARDVHETTGQGLLFRFADTGGATFKAWQSDLDAAYYLGPAKEGAA